MFHNCDDCYVLTMRHNRVNCVEKKAMMRLFGFLVCPELPEALMEIVSSSEITRRVRIMETSNRSSTKRYTWSDRHCLDSQSWPLPSLPLHLNWHASRLLSDPKKVGHGIIAMMMMMMMMTVTRMRTQLQFILVISSVACTSCEKSFQNDLFLRQQACWDCLLCVWEHFRLNNLLIFQSWKKVKASERQNC